MFAVDEGETHRPRRRRLRRRCPGARAGPHTRARAGARAGAGAGAGCEGVPRECWRRREVEQHLHGLRSGDAAPGGRVRGRVEAVQDGLEKRDKTAAIAGRG